jgi:hypothetical protein
VQTQTLSSRLSFKPQSLEALTIESPLAPADVIENIRAAGKEWRQSAIPEDLKRFKVQLSVEISGYDFEMHWAGSVSPFYNPVLYGAVDWTPMGSRIRIGFGRNKKILRLMALYAAMAILPLLNGGDRIYWTLSTIMAISLGFSALHNRRKEPMRSRLIDVVRDAATRERVATAPFPTALSGNGP